MSTSIMIMAIVVITLFVSAAYFKTKRDELMRKMKKAHENEKILLESKHIEEIEELRISSTPRIGWLEKEYCFSIKCPEICVEGSWDIDHIEGIRLPEFAPLHQLRSPERETGERKFSVWVDPNYLDWYEDKYWPAKDGEYNQPKTQDKWVQIGSAREHYGYCCSKSKGSITIESK